MIDDDDDAREAQESTRKIVRALTIGFAVVASVTLLAWLVIIVVGGWTLATFD